MDDHLWQNEALCKGMDSEIFFGRDGVAMTDEEIQRAKAVCAQCPVWRECREYAVSTNIGHGVWGMASIDDRRKLRRAWVRERGAQQRRDAADRAQTAHKLAEMGCSSDQIAGQLGVTIRTAQRLTAPTRVSVAS